MKCPYCSKEMEKRYLESADALWLNPDKMYPFYPGYHKDTFPLFSKKLKFAKGCYLEVYCCSDCRKVIFDIPDFDK